MRTVPCLLSLVLFSSASFAACEHALRAARRTREPRLERTHQIKDAWTPVLVEIARRLDALEPTVLRAQLRRMRLKPHRTEPTMEGKQKFDVIRARGVPFDRMFIGHFRLGVDQVVGFSAHNKASMRHLLRTVAVTDHYLREWSTELAATPEFAAARAFLDQASFTGSDVEHGLSIANLTLLQATSWLTADPVDGFSEFELLRAVLSSGGGRASPASQLALATPPNLLARFATEMYTRHPLARSADGRLLLTAALKEFLERAQPLVSNMEVRWSLGFGCPLAFKAGVAKSSGLQIYLNAVARISDVLAQIE